MLNGLFAIWSPVIYRKYLRQCYKSVLLGWYTLQQIYWYTLVQNAWYTLLQIIHPQDYMFELNESEFADLRSKFSTTKFAKTRVLPKAFSEKGLYMVATILRSQQAIDATFAIIETFSKQRELSRSIKQLSATQNKAEQKSLMQKSGELIADIFDEDLQTSDTETSIELNFALLKFKHTIKKKTH